MVSVIVQVYNYAAGASINLQLLHLTILQFLIFQVLFSKSFLLLQILWYHVTTVIPGSSTLMWKCCLNSFETKQEQKRYRKLKFKDFQVVNVFETIWNNINKFLGLHCSSSSLKSKWWGIVWCRFQFNWLVHGDCF